MPKRIALFILGVVIAVGAFLLYQLITGASIGPTAKPRGLAVTEPSNSGIDITEMDGEKPVYEITAAGSPEQIKDEKGNPRPGQFLLHQLIATWYDKSGRTLEVRGDSCEIQMAPGAAGAGMLKSGGSPGARLNGVGAEGQNVDLARLHWEDFSGTLKGHVYLTISPLPANARNSATKDQLPMGLRIYFDEPLHLDGSQALLTTTGGIHIRSSVIESDGKGLQLVLNPNAKPQRIEFLQLEDNPAGNQIVFRGAGNKVSAMTDRTATEKKTSAPSSQPALAKGPAASQTVPARPGKQPEPPAPPVAYRLSFGEKVLARAQQGSLSSDHLYLKFMPTREAAEPDTTTAAPKSIAGGSTPAATASAPAPMNFPEEPAPIQPVQADDLSVTWSGPMELRPMDPVETSQLALRGSDDFALEAVGTPERPVLLSQNTTRTTLLAEGGEKKTVPSRESSISIRAGRLLYPGQDRPITISPGDVAQVVLHQSINNLLKAGDTSDQQITSGEVVYTPDISGQGKDHAVLAGPGTLVSKTPTEQLTTNWSTRMDVDLEPPPDSKGGSDRAIARAILQGAVISSRGGDSDLDLAAQVLDVQMANFIIDGKAAQAPSKLFAQGGVSVKTWKKESGGKSAAKTIADDRRDRPDGILTDSLTIFSKVAAGSPAPVLSQMVADGHVTAWRYTSGSGDLGLGSDAAANAPMTTHSGPRDWTKNSLITPHLVTDLSAKAPTETRPAAPAGQTANGFDSVVGNVEPSHVRASGGVRVLIEPAAGSQRAPIDLLADVLDADPIHLSAHFSASRDADAPLVIAKRGNDSITAAVMDLSQARDNSKHDILDIPVPGSFEFQSREAGDKSARTFLASWTDSMHFDTLEQLATIKGHPIVRVEGDNQELDKLLCDDELDVHLKPREKTSQLAARGSQDDAAFDLDWLEAVGNVQASGTQLASEKKPAARPGEKSTPVAQTGARPEKLLEMYVSANDDTGADHRRIPGRLKFNSATQSFEIPGSGALHMIDHRPKTAGDSVFGWKQAMKFDGNSGTVTFTRGVDLFFTPEKGFNFLAGATPAPDKKPPGTQKAKQTAHLHTDQLTAKLLKALGAATQSSSPIAFDAAGLDNVTATGNVQITFDDLTFTGVTLTYNMPTQIATIEGTEDELASAERNGAHVEADRYILDTTKDQYALTAIRPRGDLEGLGLSK